MVVFGGDDESNCNDSAVSHGVLGLPWLIMHHDRHAFACGVDELFLIVPQSVFGMPTYPRRQGACMGWQEGKLSSASKHGEQHRERQGVVEQHHGAL